MHTALLTIAVIGLALASHFAPSPWDCRALFCLVAVAINSIWTRRNAMRKVAHGVSDRYGQELDELIAEAKRRANLGSSSSD